VAAVANTVKKTAPDSQTGHVRMSRPRSVGASSTHDITTLLAAWSNGDGRALEALVPLVYEELHRLARRHMRGERVGHPLQTTALVNEAYLRLRNAEGFRCQNRAHFYAIAARAMRRVLIDFARARHQQKRDGGQRVELDEAVTISAERGGEVMALDDALTTLATLDQRQSQIVELRFFGGLTEREIAEVLQVSPRTVSSEWSVARSWLLRELSRDDRRDA
jgi:RNA polymerase sigma-70 factor, ECF subfamily